ncbi:hypothetical protein MUK42_37689 [Musa troglodytarum]|uniref:Uncharacterized protein n=1 Tax=Musa troglodytarum TaxID=320322 RepID=A0A9E7L2D7_9LILI|nr:hypothetical protein MUK42_37689 [Musa troglodytarum]
MEIRESAMSPRLGIGSEAEKLSSPRTPKKHSLPAEDKVEADFASKEEAFFDLQGWLDSDSEDDFVSVNGDSTPFSFGTNKAFSADTFPDATSQPSSTVANGKLVDLLQENPSPESEINGKPGFSEIDATLLPGIPHDGTSHVAAVGTPSKDEKSGKCCLLPLLCRLSFKEKRKQKMMSSFH